MRQRCVDAVKEESMSEMNSERDADAKRSRERSPLTVMGFLLYSFAAAAFMLPQARKNQAEMSLLYHGSFF